MELEKRIQKLEKELATLQKQLRKGGILDDFRKSNFKRLHLSNNLSLKLKYPVLKSRRKLQTQRSELFAAINQGELGVSLDRYPELTMSREKAVRSMTHIEPINLEPAADLDSIIKQHKQEMYMALERKKKELKKDLERRRKINSLRS